MTPDQIIAAIVKPLEWREFRDGNRKAGECFSTRSPVSFAPIAAHKKHDGWWLNIDCETYSSLAAAQAAAEADYRARIAASLDLGKVVALVEAGRKLISLVDRTQEDLDRGGSPLENLYERVEDAEDEIRATLAAFKGIQP